MKKIKIAYLSVFYPFRGGIAQFNNELFLALSSIAEVKAFNFSRQYPKLLFPGKTQLVGEGDPNPGIKSDAVLDSINPISYKKTINAIRKFQPDVLITAYWMPFFAPSLGMVLRSIKARKIALLHNVTPHEKGRMDDVLNRFYLKNNDGFVVLSDTVKNQLLHYLPSASYLQVKHPLYRHFGNKLNQEDARLALKVPQNKKLLLFFGFIRKYKGLDLLLEALKLLDEEVCLLVAGESYEGDEIITEQIEELQLQNRVFLFTRYISDEEVKLFFSAADLCVLPYRSATQSGIASIAKHFELPMVVTPVGELPNEIEHLKNGFVCQKVNSDSIREGINRALPQIAGFTDFQRKDNAEHTFENFAMKLLGYVESKS